MKQQIALLKGDPKPYDWGGSAYIPSLLQIENPNQQPYAEYWMGVHPQAKCLLQFNDGQEMLLREYIAEDPENLLGERVFKTFGNMPYL
ncbi:MAG TPA: mannose-6-phosphate isomerase, class I, partial [Niabella sp.]|nr:mannose-6-phosphate isomerase, class I [Niabella sp.]